MRHVILYDGLCGLCNGFVRFVLRWDQTDVFRFSPLQGSWAKSELRRLGRDPDQMNTVVVIRDADSPTPGVLDKGAAALFVLDHLRFWNRLARIAGILPKRLLNALYDRIARHRYRIFGKLVGCPVPPDKHRHKFI